MKVLYLIQSHKNPEQICRLVQTIKKSSSKSQILISHDFDSCPLDVTSLERQPGVHVIKKNTKGVRGDFSLVEAYLDSLEWLFTQKVDFDWLINLSGQDYPTQPLYKFEQFLEETKFDGFLQYADLFSKDSYYGLKESSDRYLYQYWHSGVQFSKWQRGLIKPFRILVNNTQSFVKIDSSYQLSVGIRDYSNPFSKDFVCYGGSYFKILSKKCVAYIYDFLKKDETLINYYRKTRNPDESCVQTILVNSGLFNLCKDYKFYIDWTSSRHGHPQTLTVKDYPTIVEKDVYFARKFDIARDSMVLDLLDSRVLPEASRVALGIS